MVSTHHLKAKTQALIDQNMSPDQYSMKEAKIGERQPPKNGIIFLGGCSSIVVIGDHGSTITLHFNKRAIPEYICQNILNHSSNTTIVE
jgi:hypothetical protein